MILNGSADKKIAWINRVLHLYCNSNVFDATALHYV